MAKTATRGGRTRQRRLTALAFALFVIHALVLYWLFHLFQDDYHLFIIRAVDDHIPLLTPFVIPYLLFIPFLAFAFILSWRKGKPTAFTFAMLAAAVLANLIYLVFPTITVRPPVTGTDIFSRLLALVYAIDDPVNLFPSGHVVFTLLATMCLYDIDRKAAYWAAPLALLIIASTVFTKQHHVLDILGGAVIATLAYRFVFLGMFRKEEALLLQKGAVPAPEAAGAALATRRPLR